MTKKVADGIRCTCLSEDTTVIDSRPMSAGVGIRRRRRCNICLLRFTTYEIGRERYRQLSAIAMLVEKMPR